MMRAMLLEFPGRPRLRRCLDRQYMLGARCSSRRSSARRARSNTTCQAGRWTNLLTGQTQQGPGWCREQHGFLSLPLMVCPGTILSLGSTDTRPDYEYADGVTFRIYELADGDEFTSVVVTPRGDGATRLTARRSGKRITASISGDIPARWRIQFAGLQTVKAETSLCFTPDPLGPTLDPAAGSNKIELELD